MSLSGIVKATLFVIGVITFTVGFELLFPGVAAWLGSALAVWELTLYAFGVAIAFVLSYQSWRNRPTK
jgi:hypothetical protein